MATKTNGKNLSLTIDAQEINADGTSVVLDREEADQEAVTFAELAGGNADQWFFTITALSDYAAGSFWDLLWTNSGNDVPYVLKPYGNAVATPAEPHFQGSATIVSKPPIGGEAGSTHTFEARLDCTDVPTRVTA